MNEKVFVDTVAWIALLNQDDALHQQASTILEQLYVENKGLITSEFILLEVADALSAPNLRGKTIRFLNQLRQMGVVTVISASQDLLNSGWQLYSQRLDKDWGLTDCTSFVLMEQQNITTAFTSDRHFTQAGFTCLLETPNRLK
ncbi:type II toxin-antitoxin system VapC family toxin [Trichothermofontia sp.]